MRNTSSRHETRRTACIGWGLCAIASLIVVAIMYRDAGIFSDRYASPDLAGPYSAIVLWCVLPLSLATAALMGILAGAGAIFVLPPVGALGALTLLSAFSLGLLFGPATVAFLVAGITDVESRGATKRIGMSLLWLLAGAAALPVLLFLLTQFHQRR